MPAFNEGDRLEKTLRELSTSQGEHHVTVFVIDDGSQPPIEITAPLPSIRIVVARHSVNLGQGAAIETARRLALCWEQDEEQSSFDAFVTMDSDGQHRAEDALLLAKAIVEDGFDVALGDRFAGSSEIPTSRRLLLWLARVFERMTTGLVLSDAHNGLRAFGPRAILRMRLRQNRMAHASELTRRISRAAKSDEPLRLVEVPVSVRYTKATLAKGQSASGAITILVDLFQAFLFEK
jgi:polyprenyl-phospho-N-acetylgalactosaminyl synthase